jgi:glycosyltransferase involved in cell wall biosynthesis
VLVTIVTPSLNGMDFVRDCIESTRMQETANVSVEHIFVDGGSSDGTPEFAAANGCTVMTRDDPSIYAALNKGSYNASGTLLGVLGCDDVFLPGALEVVVQHHLRTGARWIIGGCRWLDARDRPRGDFRAPPSWLRASMLASLDWSCIPHISTFLHRDLFVELGGFDPTLRYAGDHEFFARALERERYSRMGRVLTGWHRHGGNLSMSPDPERLREIRMVMERYGPPSAWRRGAYRYLLKTWLNGTNPKWFVCKHADAVRAWRARASDAVTGS